jgi:hypothetical protein
MLFPQPECIQFGASVWKTLCFKGCQQTKIIQGLMQGIL